MDIGVVKEIKRHEFRVGLTPNATAAYVDNGHKVYLEKGAGLGSGFADGEYKAKGAVILDTKQEVYFKSEMVIKVKEPIFEEYEMFQKSQIIFSYLHLAADKKLTEALVEKEVSAVAYETITDKKGGLPCLAPMSAIAGKLASQAGAKYLEKPLGGRGVLLGGVPGVKRGKVVIVGGGVVGLNAAKIAVGLGAEVVVLDLAQAKLDQFDDLFGSRITTLVSNRPNILDALASADLIVGAVLIAGAKAPKLILKSDLKALKPGVVIVDVAIDQGGCVETSRPTSYDEPTFVVDGVVHYCVANMPGAVPLTATEALSSTTVPYGTKIANKGLLGAIKEDSNLLNGVNTHAGAVVNWSVAKSLNFEYTKLAV